LKPTEKRTTEKKKEEEEERVKTLLFSLSAAPIAATCDFPLSLSLSLSEF